jgi:hypothetical protein
MLRDLDKELSDFASRRQKSSSGSSSGGSGSSTRARAASAAGAAAEAAAGAAKSLWDELFEIGEEFVEFLEQASMQACFLTICGCFPVRNS